MNIVLIAGLWLDGSAWDEVVPHLEELGHRPLPLTLPGSAAATLDEQVAAVLDAVDAASGEVMVVGHSAAATLAWLAADARPARVAKVVLIGGFPVSGGKAYHSYFEVRDGVIPFPGWEPFEGPDSADLSEEAKREFAAKAIPVPAGVAAGVARLRDERRFGVPVVVVCPEFSAAEAREYIAAEVPELAKVRHLDLVDIDSGHWPMITQPAGLARLLATAARG